MNWRGTAAVAVALVAAAGLRGQELAAVAVDWKPRFVGVEVAELGLKL